jgi:carboxylesterase
MNPFRIPPDTSVHEPALPAFLPGGSKAVFLIHGYTGNVSEMMHLAERLHQSGFTVSVPRLPGHGTCIPDFLQTNRHHWLRFCLDHYLDLSARYDTVYVAGLSMGGLLSVLVAEIFRPEKIALLAPALKVRNPLIHLTPFLSPFVSRLRREYESDPEENPALRAIHDEYWKYEYPRQVAQLYALQKQAKRGIARVAADTLVIVSEKDRTVPVQTGAYLERKLVCPVRTVVLKESGHILTTDVEKERVAEEVIQWFGDKKQNQIHHDSGRNTRYNSVCSDS